MISSISVSNYRKFEEKYTFEAAPITIFTGPNNSGKSSVLESILILRDSMSTNGLKNLDFMGGRHKLISFDDTINRKTDKNTFNIGIGIPMRRSYTSGNIRKNSILPRSKGKIPSGSFMAPEQADGYSPERLETTIDFYFERKIDHRTRRIDIGFRRDEEAVLSFRVGSEDSMNTGPHIEEGEVYSENIPSGFTGIYLNGPLLKKYIEEERGALSYTTDSSISEDHIQRLLGKLDEAVTFIVFTQGHKISLSKLPEWVRMVSYTGRFPRGTMPLDEQAEEADGMLEKASLALKKLLEPFVEDCVDRVRRELATSEITSLRNLRAGSQPFYRREAIPPGFAQLLEEAAGEQINPPEKWLKTFKIGDGVSVERKVEIDGYTVHIERQGETFPLSALGEGSAQVLPLILYQNYGLGRDRTSHLILQEPETNLHPDLQSKLADLFTAIIEKGQDEIGPRPTGALSRTGRLIVETHSEYLIRRLQLLVARGKLSTEDVVIHYLGDGKEKGSELRRIDIDEYGQLTQPFGSGFFDEATKLMVDLFEYGSEN